MSASHQDQISLRLEDRLGGLIGIGSHNSQDDTLQVFHMISNNRFHDIDITLGLCIIRRLDQPRKIDQCQMWLIRSRDLRMKFVLANCATLPELVDVLGRVLNGL